MGARKLKTSDVTDTATATPPKGKAKLRQSIKVVPAGESFAHRDIVVDQAAFVDAVQKLRHVASSGSTMPILNTILVRPETSLVTLVATDLAVTISVEIPGTCKSTKATAIPAKRLLEVSRALPSGPLALDHVEECVKLSGGRASFTLEALHAQDYPKRPSTEGVSWCQINGEDLRAMLDKVEFSVCRDETRFHLNGVFLLANGLTLTAITTDGHRLTKARKESITSVAAWGKKLEHGVIVPHKAVAELRRLLEDGACDIGCEGAFLHVRQGAVTLSAKLIDAQFPPYEQVIPRDNDHLVTVDRKALIEALKRAKIAATDTRGVALSASSGALTLGVDSTDEIRAMSEALDAEYAGDPASWGVNPQYLLELLARIDDTRVVIAFGEELNPALVRSVDDATMRPVMDANLLGVIMPMRMK